MITQYKNNKFSNRNNTNLKYSYTDDNLENSNNNKTHNNNNNNNNNEEKKNDYHIFPIVKKISLKNVFYDENYHKKEIQNLIDCKKEKEKEKERNNENENEKKDINNINRYDRLSLFIKFKNNNIKKRNEFINNVKKSETYNKKIKNVKSNDKNNFSKNDKYDCKSLIKTINNNSSYKSYFIHKYTPKRRRKHNNEDILDLLGKNE